MESDISRVETIGWVVAGLLLVAFAIPWFAWGDGSVVYGIPLWVWWHVAWMVVASVTFYAFTRRAWGLGVAGVNRG